MKTKFEVIDDEMVRLREAYNRISRCPVSWESMQLGPPPPPVKKKTVKSTLRITPLCLRAGCYYYHAAKRPCPPVCEVCAQHHLPALACTSVPSDAQRKLVAGQLPWERDQKADRAVYLIR